MSVFSFFEFPTALKKLVFLKLTNYERPDKNHNIQGINSRE